MHCTKSPCAEAGSHFYVQMRTSRELNYFIKLVILDQQDYDPELKKWFFGKWSTFVEEQPSY